MTLQALIFDVDGTLAETEETHRLAFNAAFEEAGLDWRWSHERYRELLAVTGGRERIAHFVATSAPEQAARDDLDAWIAGLHRSKTRHYTQAMAGGRIALRPGVERLIREARAAGVRLGIATTTSEANIEALFAATLGREALGWFEAIGAAPHAPVKKPEPAVYLWVLERLGLAPGECLALEDTANGVRAASAAGVPVLVTASFYSEGEDFGGALGVLSDLGEPGRPYRVLEGLPAEPGCVDLAALRAWHERGCSRSS